MKKVLVCLFATCLFLSCLACAEEAVTPQALLSGMATEQKIAQLLMPAFYYRQDAEGNRIGVDEIYPEMEEILHKYGFGGVIFNLQNARETSKAVRLANAVQAANASTPGRTQLMIFTDQEGGYVTRLGQGTQMPGSMALGAVNDLSVTEAAGRLIGSEVVAMGFSGTFGPVVDVNNNPANPVIGVRAFGDRPEQVAAHGIAFLEGLRNTGALSTLKHFPGHGDTDTDSHTGLPCMDKSYDELREFELIPFQACIDAGADMVMTAHIVYPQVEKGTYTSLETGETIGLPATLSKTILTDILRGDMGFSGLVVSDAMNMVAIAKHFDPLDAARLAIEAGVDLILRPVETDTLEGLTALEKYIQDVAALADEGKISMETVDTAVLRILTFKEKYGLLNPYDPGNLEQRVQRATETVGSPEHHEEEWAISKRAVTLLKNESTLPLNLQESTAILVAADTQIMSAEYAVSRLKDEGKLSDEAAIPAYCLSAMSVGDLIKLAQDTRHLIAVSSSYSSDNMNPEKKDGAKTAMLDAVIDIAHAAGNDVTIISAHLPYDASHYKTADAIVAIYGARGMTENPRNANHNVNQYGPNIPACLYMLLSGEEMTGILPVDIPVMDDRNQFTGEILYAHGYGLTLSDIEK